MDEAFEKLKKEGKNDVDNLVQWMKDSKLIETTKESEEKARLLFKDVEDLSNIELDKFKQALKKLADEQKKSIDEFTKLLLAERPKLLDAMTAGAKAFKEAMEK